MAASPLPPPSTPRRTAAEMALRACRSPQCFALAVLALAMLLGAGLRFHRLERSDLSADEAASWAAASAPGVRQVMAMEQQLDPGKLPLYDLLLHGWIRVFGDDVPAMRAMSAGLGTIAIVLVFVAVREVCRSLGDAPAPALGELAGAFAALIYATNVTMLESDRTVRMYPLVMCAALVQIAFLARVQRRGGWFSYAGLAIFTAAMIAANFTASFLLLAEGLWLGCLLLARFAGARPADARPANAVTGGLAVFRPGAALAAGVVLLVPLLPGAFASSHQAVAVGAIDWIKPQPLWWPYLTLRIAAGGHKLFWIFAALGAYGVWQQWRSAPLASGFFAAWTAGPFLGVMAVTYLLHPLEYFRYVLAAFAGMFGLAGLGAASLRSSGLRLAVAVLLIFLSMRQVGKWLRHSHEAAWREATMLAAGKTAPGDQIAVFPPYCTNVVRYYLPQERRGAVIGADSQCTSARLLIMSGFSISAPAALATMEACFPRVLARPRLTEVRSR